MHSKESKLFSLFLMVFVLVAAAFPMGSAAQAVTAPPSAGIDAALAYLRTQQTPDGGINSFGAGADPDGTARALLGLAAAGLPPEALTSSEGKTPLDYLDAQAQAFAHDAEGRLFPGRAGMLLAALAVSRPPANDALSANLVVELEAAYQNAAYATDAAQDWASGAASDLNQAWAVFGLALAGRAVPAQATGYLLLSQAEDGSWGNGDPDTTALAVAALIASGNLTPGDAAIRRAVDYFRTTQLESGGWRPTWDTDPLNADTTGWVLQALRLAGENPVADEWSKAGVSPLAALAGLQKEDGSLGGTYANAYSTADALVGLGGSMLHAAAPLIHRAGMLVQFADGSAAQVCVPFTEDSLTGYELLERSGLVVESVTDPSLGRAVCRIQADGCEISNCFCDMPNYWSYWRLTGGEWGYAPAGADQNLVKDGDVDGWAWGEGMPPQAATFDQLCPGPADSLQVETMFTSGMPAPAATAESVPWVLVILVLVLLILALIVLLVLRRRKA